MLRMRLLALVLTFAHNAHAEAGGDDVVLVLRWKGSFGVGQLLVCRGHALVTARLATSPHRRPWAEPELTLSAARFPRDATADLLAQAPDMFGERIFDQG